MHFEKLNDLPIKSVDGAIIYMRDVASVRDGNRPQTNIVRVDGSRAVLMPILAIAVQRQPSDIVSNVKKLLPTILESLPPSVRLDAIGDQSVFVKAAVSGVAREAVIAALLTSVMILLFLGSWRSTLIITVSIPLAILSSIVGLYAMGETLNIMTLGGLALAVGILVDDATVTIENINWHLEQGKEVRTAIMDGAHQIVGPALVSLLCICIVFIPMFFLNGVAHYLFVPMAEAVVFAMIASFFLSRTLVPTMAAYLLRVHSIDGHPSGEIAADDAAGTSVAVQVAQSAGAFSTKAFEQPFCAHSRCVLFAVGARDGKQAGIHCRVFGDCPAVALLSFRGSARISFPQSIPDKSICMCGLR